MKRIKAELSGIERIRYRPSRADGMTLLDAIADHALFAKWFNKNVGSWSAWFAFIAALFALPMTEEQLAFYRKCTGRSAPPASVATEAWLVCGRRAGKSFVLALVAVFLACFYDYRKYLAPGERGTVMVIASDRKQARTILRYVGALLREVPLLAKMIERETAEGFDLSNRVTIEVGTSSFRSVRGYTIVAGLLDELAFWSSEDASDPDFEVLNAIRPGMSTIPNAMLLCASSPYARRGVLWDAHRQHFGKDGDPILCWVASTRQMNPTVPQGFIDAEYERDPASAAAEYGAQFRSDIEAFVSREAVQACVSTGVFERAREPDISYSAFIDPSGGSGKDSFTLAIGHKDRSTDMAVLDAVREHKPPFSPEAVVAEYGALLKSYGVSKLVGDRFAGEWAREPFRKIGIAYEPAAKPKSDIYRDFLPLINSRKADLLDHPKTAQQLVSLERRTSRSGKDSIDHPPNGHDDCINVVAGVLTNLNARRYAYDSDLLWVGGENGEYENWIAEQRARYVMNGGFR
ncbi:terminase large subunit domain-containing protein [Tardiphaga sp. 604_B6_N1_1]|uniref:terminase large subunit domain-containing protein n=1 Tax=Tardiphaga sp. 604_B6_N1_1 TaxID=3240779 RepID=UPI003F28B650